MYTVQKAPCDSAKAKPPVKGEKHQQKTFPTIFENHLRKTESTDSTTYLDSQTKTFNLVGLSLKANVIPEHTFEICESVPGLPFSPVILSRRKLK
jgi:hypothetical protein